MASLRHFGTEGVRNRGWKIRADHLFGPPGRSTGGCRWTRAAVRARAPRERGPAGTASSAWRGSRTTTPWDGPGADGAPGPRAAVEAGLGAGSLLLTAGQAGDCPMMIPVLEAISAERPARGRPRTRPDRVLADRAYSSRANRDWLRAHHIHATIQAPTPRQPSSPNQPHQTTSMSPRTDKPKQSTATVR